MNRTLTTFALFLGFAAGGCSFSRSVVNPHHVRHDTSWIVPGETTRTEVIGRLGMPPHVIRGRGGVRDGSFRWVTGDTFTGTLEIGYILTPTFQTSRERVRHDLLIRFDEDDVVSLVSHTESVNGKNRVIRFKEAP